MILVTGATGNVGAEVVRRLVEQHADVAAFVRDVAKAQTLFPTGVRLVPGDLTDPASYADALAGVTQLFLSTPNTLDQVDQEKAWIDAATRVGVDRVVKLSGGAADSAAPGRIARWHGEVEDYLRASGLIYTNLQPEFFMQNLLGSAGLIAQGRLPLPLGRAPLGLVDMRDIAAVAARVLLEPGRHDFQTYKVTGPQALTMNEVAAVLTAELGHGVEYQPIGAEEFYQQLTGWGVPAWLATALNEVFTAVAAGNANFTTDTVARIGQVQSRTVADFVRDHAAAFRLSEAAEV